MTRTGRPPGSKQQRDQSKYWLPEGLTLKLNQTDGYNKVTPLIFIDPIYGEFTSTFYALQGAKKTLHPEAKRLRMIETNTSNSQKSRKKAQDTMFRKYGVYNALQSPQFLKASRSKLKEKYGDHVTSPFSVGEIRAKSKETLMKNHGVTNAAKTTQTRILPNGKNVKEYCREKDVSPCMAYKLFWNYGPQVAQDWIDDHKLKVSGLETATKKLVPELTRFEMCPPGVKNFKPDFTLNGVYIDVDGLEYHSETYKDENAYHLRKRETFEAAGHKLLQFRQDEILLKPDIVKSMIKVKTGTVTTTIGASRLEFVVLSKKEADVFLNRTHLMGSSNGVSCFGLKTKDGILKSVMTIKIKSKEMEIVRFSSELETIVNGGLSRLLSNIQLKYAGLFNKIIYFVDLRYGSGDGVSQLGFTRVSTTLGWKWTDTFHTFNRLHCRANMDERKLTEKEHAKEMKLVKIYDAGQAKYVHTVEVKNE